MSEIPPGGVCFGFEMNTDVFFPAFGALKPTSPYAWVDGHLRARPGRPHRRCGRRRAGPAAVFPPRHGVRAAAHPGLRELAAPAPPRPTHPDARGATDRDTGPGRRCRIGKRRTR